VTPNDAWENRMRLPGKNTFLGWSAQLPNGGNGAKSLGMELANSGAFAQCQVEKVFRTVCFRSPTAADASHITSATDAFANGGGNLKQTFAATAAYCAGN
jgi:hypothetical protein